MTDTKKSPDLFDLTNELRCVSAAATALRYNIYNGDLTDQTITGGLAAIENHLDRIAADLDNMEVTV